MTRDLIFPLYVPTEASRDLTLTEVHAPILNVQDAPKSLIALHLELTVLIAQLNVNSALRLPAAQTLKSKEPLDLTFPMVLHVLISLLLPRELSPREPNLLPAVLAQLPLLVHRSNLSALLALSAQQ